MARNAPKFPKRKCAVCGVSFVPSSPRAMTCSRECSLELNRIKTLDKAREKVFLKPYSVAEKPAERPSHREPSTVKKGDGGESKRSGNGSGSRIRNASQKKKRGEDWTEKEPATAEERERQTEEVVRVMALPYTERWQFARHWSRFQRHAGMSIERKRIAEECDFSPYNTLNR